MIGTGKLYSNVWEKKIPDIMSKLECANRKIEHIKLDHNDFVDYESMPNSGIKTFTFSIIEGVIPMHENNANADDLRLALLENGYFRGFAKDKEIAIRMTYPECVLSMVYKDKKILS